MLPIASLRHPEFVRGLKDCLPVLFGMLPFALILGAQAAQKGMSLLETVLMMGLNYAGGSEFAAVGLWASPIPVLLIIAMTTGLPLMVPLSMFAPGMLLYTGPGNTW